MNRPTMSDSIVGNNDRYSLPVIGRRRQEKILVAMTIEHAHQQASLPDLSYEQIETPSVD